MNRKERRKQGIKTAPRTYTMTDAQIKKIKDDAVDEALQLLLAIPVLVLHDKYGFGKQRLTAFVDYTHTWVKAVHQDPNTLSEVVKTAQEEAGYQIVLD